MLQKEDCTPQFCTASLPIVHSLGNKWMVIKTKIRFSQNEHTNFRGGRLCWKEGMRKEKCSATYVTLNIPPFCRILRVQQWFPRGILWNTEFGTPRLPSFTVYNIVSFSGNPSFLKARFFRLSQYVWRPHRPSLPLRVGPPLGNFSPKRGLQQSLLLSFSSFSSSFFLYLNTPRIHYRWLSMISLPRSSYTYILIHSSSRFLLFFSLFSYSYPWRGLSYNLLSR